MQPQRNIKEVQTPCVEIIETGPSCSSKNDDIQDTTQSIVRKYSKRNNGLKYLDKIYLQSILEKVNEKDQEQGRTKNKNIVKKKLVRQDVLCCFCVLFLYSILANLGGQNIFFLEID